MMILNVGGFLLLLLQMWDIRKKGCIFGYKGHNSTVNSLKFSPDGQWIASGGEDNYVKIWDIRVGKVLSEFSDHTGSVTDVEFHPHEFLLASSSLDRTVKFWDLETFSLVSSSLADVPPIRCITYHPNGSCLFAASPDILRVHGWEPPETFDAVPTPWSRIQDIAVSQDQLVGVTTQLTNVSIYVVDLRRVHPVGNSKSMRASLSSGHSLRKNFNKERSSEFAESLNAMKASEESDSLPTDPEDEVNVPLNQRDFRQIFAPHRDCGANSSPADYIPDEEPSLATSTESESPRPESYSKTTKFRYVNSRESSRNRHSPENTPRRASVPNFVPGQVAHNHNNRNLSPGVCLTSRSRSPDCMSRQSSLSDDSSGPYSGRSTETHRSTQLDSGYNSHSQPPVHTGMANYTKLYFITVDHYVLSSPSESSLIPSPSKENVQYSSPAKTNPPLQPLPRSPERPLAHRYDFVPIPIDRPSGLAIDDFLPKKSAVAYDGGIHAVDVSEADVFTNLAREHQPILAVMATRQRNLRIIFNVWQTKDVKTAVEAAVNLHDIAVVVDLLGVLVLRPSIWNLDLCVALLPSILQLLQSRYEAHLTAGCNALRLILKNFASVIKTNIESPIQTVGVDISREERYNKSMECYRHLVAIRAFTLKRQTLQGKIGHTFRELHIHLSSLD
ncbi:Katanin p80 WD40 repeat-containing subunit B1 [Orchesella cincta]|uniref:Katanin p80 WD40 repeat-containing subunit B1 n=1 Tax=Orchesella cincta TaxID=48709 RepID=A0A1D2NG94_ORCCI|nr:Katanin p80 WD40 repeat-containing subunit B1 [Orchesella cincta]